MRRHGAVLLLVSLLGLWSYSSLGQEDYEGRLSFSGAWALYPMVVCWGEEFQKIHPRVQFDISAGGAGKGMTDVLAGAVDIGMVSREISQAEIEKGAFAFAVVKDAVIPMINAGNPALVELRRKGVNKDVIAGIWIRRDVITWGQVAHTDQKAPIRVYTRSDACGAADTWALYIGKKQEDLKGVGVYGDPGIGEAVRRDPLAVGYNNVNYAYDSKTKKPVAGLAVLPLDVNGNGVLDAQEDFYATRDLLAAAIASGDYPSPPARDLYLVAKGKPANPLLTAFIHWVLTDGQKYVSESGYIHISDEKLAAGMNKLGVKP